MLFNWLLPHGIGYDPDAKISKACRKWRMLRVKCIFLLARLLGVQVGVSTHWLTYKFRSTKLPPIADPASEAKR